MVLSWSCCLNHSDVRSGTPTDSEVGDGDPMAEGDAGNFGQVRPGLQRARACEGVPVPHPLQQRRQQCVLAAQPRARTCRTNSTTNLPKEFRECPQSSNGRLTKSPHPKRLNKKADIPHARTLTRILTFSKRCRPDRLLWLSSENFSCHHGFLCNKEATLLVIGQLW